MIVEQISKEINLYDAFEIYIFLQTHKDELELNVTFDDLIQALQSNNETMGDIWLKIQRCIMNYFVYDKVCRVNYFAWLSFISIESIKEWAMVITRMEFFKQFFLLAEVSLLIKRLEEEDVNVIEFRSEDFLNDLEPKIKFFKFLFRYVFRECDFVKELVQLYKIAHPYLKATKEQFTQFQNTLFQDLKNEKLIRKELSEELDKLMGSKNQTQAKRQQAQKTKREFEKINIKIKGTETIIPLFYEEFQLFNIQVRAILEQENNETIYVVKNIKNNLFRKIINNNDSCEFTIIKGKQLEDYLNNIENEETKQKVQLLQGMDFFSDSQEKKKLLLNQNEISKADHKELRKLGFKESFAIQDLKGVNLEEYIKKVIIETEIQFHQFEYEYWESSWATEENRILWRKEVEAASDIIDLQEVIRKFPSMISIVSKGFVQVKEDDESGEQKFKKQKLFWIHLLNGVNFKFLIIENQSKELLYVLCVSMYLDLLIYIQKQKLKRDPIQKIENSQKLSFTSKNLRQRGRRTIYDEDEYLEMVTNKLEFDDYAYKKK